MAIKVLLRGAIFERGIQLVADAIPIRLRELAKNMDSGKQDFTTSGI